MKINRIENSSNEGNIKFRGQRVFRNTVSQLARNNKYSYTTIKESAFADSFIGMNCSDLRGTQSLFSLP